MNTRFLLLPMLATLFISGCASLPEGPNVTALPGSGKSFDYFRADDAVCRDYAHTQIGGKAPVRIPAKMNTDSGRT